MQGQRYETLEPSCKKFRLAVSWTDPAIPFSLGRVVGPLAMMTKEDPRLELSLPQASPHGGLDVDWHWLEQCDALYMQNPISDAHSSLISLAKLMGMPVWSDWGDDVFSVHPTNPNYAAFANRAELRENIAAIMRASDICTVPTETTRKVFPNPDRLAVIGEACRWPQQTKTRQKIVSWRGMSSHEEDVLSVLPEWQAVAADPKYADWRWLLYGDPPWRLKAALSEVLGEPWEGDVYGNKRLLIAPPWPTPFHMFASWAGWAPYLHVVPLADNAFGRSKPPNAWMEATAVGAATIAPDFEEWQVPGCLHYHTSKLEFKDKVPFGQALRQEMDTFKDGALHPAAVSSQAEIYPNLTLTAVNQRRWIVLRKLWNNRRKLLVPGFEV